MGAAFVRNLIVVPGVLLLAVSARAQADSTAVPMIDTPRAWEHVANAREFAAEDDHRDAVAAYLRALARDARLVADVAHEISFQKLWNEEHEKALFYFRRYFARHPDGVDRDVRKGLALALSWSGRQPQAVALYAELVAEEPGDGDARFGLGRSLIWDNRLHEGYTVLRGVERDFPAAAGPGREASEFLLSVLDGYPTHLDLRVDASWDSDDLDILRISPHGSVTVMRDKLLQIMPSLAIYRQPDQPDIRAPRLGAGFVTALAHNWALHAYAWYDMFRSSEPLFGGTDKLNWNRLGGDAWVTWLPVPRVRTDLGATSQAVETFAALDNHLHYEQVSLSGDWRFAPRWSANLTGMLATYSDGNDRSRARAALTWRRPGRWQIEAGPVLTYMDFAVPYPGGYWAPDWVRNGSVEAAISTRSRVMTYRLSGALGQEKELGSDSKTVGSVAGRVGWRFRPGWLGALEAGWSKSSFAPASGYSRTFASVSARALF